jgi:hypothetical protein
MARFLSLSFLAVLVSSVLSAQADASADREPIVVEMKIERSLSPDSNGAGDLLGDVQANKLILHYNLQNPTRQDMRVSPEVATADEVNCATAVARQPETLVAAGGSTPMTIEVSLNEPGPFSFVVNMVVDGRDYTFPVQSTVTVVLHDDEYYHCHDGDCHYHEEEHHHCSTGEGRSWLMLGGMAAVLAALMFRRRAA